MKGSTVISKSDGPIGQKINSYLNYALMAFAFVLPLSRSGISLLIGVILILWLMEGDWKNKWTILKSDRLFQVLSAYVGFILFSLLWTDNYTKAIGNMKNYGHLLLIPVMYTSLKPDFRLKLFTAFATGMSVLLTLSLLNYFKVIRLTNMKSIGSAHILMHHLDYSMFLAWTGIFGIYFLYAVLPRLYQGYSLRIQISLWIPLTMFCIFWVFIQTGRSGQLAFVVVFPILILFVLKLKNKFFPWLAIAGLLVFLAIQYKLNPKFQDRVEGAIHNIKVSYNEKYYSTPLGNRILAHLIAWDMFKKSPITGYGIGDNMDVFSGHVEILKKQLAEKKLPRLKTIHQITRNHMHSQYLQVITETGLVGMALFFSIFWFWKHGSLDKKAALLLILFFFTGFLAEPFMINQFTSALIAFFMALIYSQKTLTSSINE